MSTIAHLKRLFIGGTRATDAAAFEVGSELSGSDIDHEIHREESFKVEALEPRILLSADPISGELVRMAEEAGRYDPASEVAALVQQIDAIAPAVAEAAEVVR